MKIAHIIDNFRPGGAQNILINTIKYSPKGFKHVIIILNGNDAKIPDILLKNTVIEVFNIKSLQFLFEINRLRKSLIRIRPDIIRLNLELSYLLYFYFLHNNFKSIPVHLAVHAIPSQIGFRWFRFMAKQNRKVTFYTVEDEIAKKALINLNVSENKIKYIPIGTDYFEQKQINLNKNSVSLNNPFTNIESPVFLNIARMVKGKGQIYLLRTFREYVLKGGQGSLCIIGYGPLETKLKQFVKKSHLENRVFFPGKITKIHPYYENSYAYVSSSINEGMGVVIVDAMAAGLPILGFDTGTIKEIVTEQENGFLVKTTKYKMLADKMFFLSNNLDLRNKIALTNKKKIYSNYRNIYISKKYFSLFKLT